MDEYGPDHEPGGQRTDDRPRRAPPVVRDRHAHAGRLFHQPPDNVHALRDTPHVPVADFPGWPVHGHLRHPPHGITERAERPPRRHFHGATARVAVQKPDPPIVRQDLGPTLDIRRNLKHPIHGCADPNLVDGAHHVTARWLLVTMRPLFEPPVGTAPPPARLRPAACHRTLRVYIPA